MQKDTRSRNQYFAHDTLANYLDGYAHALHQALGGVDKEELEKAQQLLKATQYRGGRVFVGGNGGSAAISDHLTCDFVKGTRTEYQRGLQVHSLVGSVALSTALSNDIGFENALSYQLDAADMHFRDLLILISSSGASKNILKAAKMALKRKASVIALTGFDGGELNKMATVKLYVPAQNYGVIEDAHQAIMHALAQQYYLAHLPTVQIEPDPAIPEVAP